MCSDQAHRVGSGGQLDGRIRRERNNTNVVNTAARDEWYFDCTMAVNVVTKGENVGDRDEAG